MLEKKRKFNKNAYDSFDSKNKIGILEIMTKKGYTLVGDIDTEHYKKYDVKFVKGGKELSFENETRITPENANKIAIIFKKGSCSL